LERWITVSGEATVPVRSLSATPIRFDPRSSASTLMASVA
jgi:hypothetical protein